MRPRDGTTDTVESLRAACTPLSARADLDPLLALVGDARYVLLGESTHGTHEYYAWRAELSMRLIAERGFSFIAVEGDWPDCYRVNRYVKHYRDAGYEARAVFEAFDRWPTWMWANAETLQLAEWLRGLNRDRDPDARVGFYGLDVYSLWDSMREVIAYLERTDPAAARQAREAYACFDRYYEDEQAYAKATLFVPTSCEDETVSMLRALRGRHRPPPEQDGRDAYFDAEQNALVARNAERYYRTMVRGGSASWNIRDRHMTETLDRLMAHHGGDAKAIVWEHNTHVGDARYTDMRRANMVNVGQLVRETHGESPRDRDGVAIVGFGTDRGTVVAGASWGARPQVMRVPPAQPGSWEALLHDAGDGQDLVVVFDGTFDGGIAGLGAVLPHRAIGVVYDPAMEQYGNWVPTLVPRRYDAFVYIDESRALDALEVRDVEREEMETYPSGM